MNGYIIKVTNNLTNEEKFVKSYTIELGNISVDLIEDINQAYVVVDDELTNVLLTCILSAVEYQYGDNVTKKVIKVERETKVVTNE